MVKSHCYQVTRIFCLLIFANNRDFIRIFYMGNSKSTVAKSDLLTDNEDSWIIIEKEENDPFVPKEILAYIFSYLEFNDLCRAACVCQMWKRISSQDMIWKELYFTKYGETKLTKESYKSTYFSKLDRPILPGSGDAILLVLDSTQFVSAVRSKLSGKIILRLTKSVPAQGLFLRYYGYEIGALQGEYGAIKSEHSYFNIKQLIKGNPSETYQFHSGYHSIPFSVDFPQFGTYGEKLQRSFMGPGLYKIQYKAEAIFEEIGGKKLVDTKVLTVLGHYEGIVGQPIAKYHGTSGYRGGISFRVHLASNVIVVPSQGTGMISITMDSINDNERNVTGVTITLTSRASGIKTLGHVQTVATAKFAFNVPGRTRTMGTNFPFLIPNAQPSFRGKVVQLEHQLRFDFHGPIEMSRLVIPIVIIGDT